MRIAFALALALLLPAAASQAASWRGLADVVLSGDEDLAYLNKYRTGDSATDFWHLRLFAEGGDDRTSYFAQLMLTDSSWDPVRVYGAYLMHRVFEDRELYVQVGRVPTVQGLWGPRNYADENPLVGVPLVYFWQTNLPYGDVPADLDALLATRDGAPGSRRANLLYENCWNDGAGIVGVENGVEYAFLVTRGAPANPEFGASANDELALNARLGYAPVPELELRVSWGRGAYLTDDATVPAGESVNGYKQDIVGASVKATRGYLVFHGEYWWNRFDTPLREDGLSAWSAWGELDWRFTPGWYAALRYDTLRFEEVQGSTSSGPWDSDIDRIEGGVGYHFSRDFTVKAVVQATDVGDGYGEETLLPMLQAVIGF